MKNAIIGISVGIISILMGQIFLLANTASAQAYGESVYGGGIYNDSRSYSPDHDGDIDKEVLPSEASNPFASARGSHSTGDQVVDQKDKPQAKSGGGALSDDMDHAPESRNEQIDPDAAGPAGNDSGSPKYLLWISLGGLAASLLLIWGVAQRKLRQDRV